MIDSVSGLYRVLGNRLADASNWLEYRYNDITASELDLDSRDVIVVAVDCLRADHLSHDGYHHATTPFLAAAESHIDAISAAPWTYSSVPSILTGAYPHRHGAAYDADLRNQDEGNPPHSITDDVHTLPEILDASGYKTHFATAIATSELPLRGRLPSRRILHDASASAMIDHMLEWWDQNAGSPRFGYVHLGDLHVPLAVPEEQPFGNVDETEEEVDRWRFTETTEPTAEFETYREERIRLYDTVLREVDRQIERLCEELERRGDFEDTLVVVTADHGEEFWERVAFEREHFHDPRGIYGVGHGHALIPEVVDVPLVVLNGDVGDPDGRVSTVDIVPTILNQLGVDEDVLDEFDGLPVDDVSEDRAVLSEEIAYGYDQRAVVRGDDHLIHSPHEDSTILLDRSTGTATDDSDAVDELLKFTDTDRQVGDQVEVDEETKERLADLGYR